MPRYFFNLRDGAAGFHDHEGVLLKNGAAATRHATCVARDLMGHCEKQRRHWQLDVGNGKGKLLLSVPFMAVDTTMAPLASETKRLVERACQNRRELGEAIFEARLAVLRSKAIRARSNGKPYLASQFGRRL